MAVLVATACARSGVGHTSAEYDPQTGRLRVFAFDSTGDGHRDTVSHMDGTRILQIEQDLDGDGQVDRWHFYDADRGIEKVGFSRLNDGVMDAQAFYDANGAVARVEMSTKRDGTFDRVEYYQQGVLTSSAEDTDGSGRHDKWETYRETPNARPGEPAYTITSMAYDESGSGRPERRFIFAADGSIERVEVDVDGSGTFTSVARR